MQPEIDEQNDCVVRGSSAGTLPLNVVVAYPDHSAANRARRVLDSLTKECGNEGLHEGNSWAFDRLRHPRLRRIATERAAKADLIILALHEDQDVPAEVRNWMESWIPKKSRAPGVLMALLDAEDELSENIASARGYLISAARRARMQLVMHTHEDLDLAAAEA